MIVKIKKASHKNISNNMNKHIIKHNNNFTISKKKPLYSKKMWLLVKSLFQIVVGTATIFAAVFAFLAFNNIGSLNDIKNQIKSTPNSQTAINEWKSELTCLHIGNNRDFIEKTIGQPILVDSIDFKSSKYNKCTYSNSYFTLICIYNDNSSLLGFLIIGNNESFNFKNYRCGFTLFDYTINEAEAFCFDKGVQSYIFLRSNNSNRLDSNSYYFECNYQYSTGATLPYIIGYGICDTGKITQLEGFRNASQSMHVAKSNEETFTQFHDSSINDSIRDFPINCFFVMSDFQDSVIFVSNFICPYSKLM